MFHASNRHVPTLNGGSEGIATLSDLILFEGTGDGHKGTVQFLISVVTCELYLNNRFKDTSSLG